jgi:small subunit ribosomal protein S2
LDQTARLFKRAFDFLSDTVARGGHVLFVGTKRQAAEIVEEEARRASSTSSTTAGSGARSQLPHDEGWPGAVAQLERIAEDGTYGQLRRRKPCASTRSAPASRKYIGGMKGMSGVPSAVFIIDPTQEAIAVAEARKLHVRSSPSRTPTAIRTYRLRGAGNDDAIRSIRLITSAIADACIWGMTRHASGWRREAVRRVDGQPRAAARAPGRRHLLAPDVSGGRDHQGSFPKER